MRTKGSILVKANRKQELGDSAKGSCWAVSCGPWVAGMAGGAPEGKGDVIDFVSCYSLAWFH